MASKLRSPLAGFHRALRFSAPKHMHRPFTVCHLSTATPRARPNIQTISTTRSYAPIGHYSQAFRANGQVWLAGQIAADIHGSLVKGTVTEQAQQICNNISAILEEAGSSIDSVVKVNVYTTDFTLLPEFNAVYNAHFPHNPPRTSAEVSKLPLDVIFMIDIIAVA